MSYAIFLSLFALTAASFYHIGHLFGHRRATRDMREMSGIKQKLAAQGEEVRARIAAKLARAGRN